MAKGRIVKFISLGDADKKLDLPEVRRESNVHVGRKAKGGGPLSQIRQEGIDRYQGTWISGQEDATKVGS